MIAEATRRAVLLGVASVAGGHGAAAQGGAPVETYPERPVQVLVGFPPGGGVDNIARLLLPRLGERLRGQFVVENRAGANGNVAMEAAARAAPDGYTLFYGNVGNLGVTNAPYPGLPFDTLRDFVPVAQTMESFLAVTVSTAVPAGNLAEFVAHARANPGRLNAGSAGAGGPSHLAFELFRRALGLDIVHVGYRGSAPAIQDLAGGRVQLVIDGYSLVRPAVDAGRARVLAVTSAGRQPLIPDVPAVAETVAGFEAGSWHALMAPVGTSPAIPARLEAEVAAVLREPQVAEAMAAQGVAPRFRGAAEFGPYLAAERERWARVVREAGITAE